MNRLKSNHQDLKLNTIIYWQPMKVVKYRFNMIWQTNLHASVAPHHYKHPSFSADVAAGQFFFLALIPLQAFPLGN